MVASGGLRHRNEAAMARKPAPPPPRTQESSGGGSYRRVKLREGFGGEEGHGLGVTKVVEAKAEKESDREKGLVS